MVPVEQLLVLVIILGISAQWIAWRINLPSILLLLIFGIVAGPVGLGLVHPNDVLGNLLGPFVSISVALILYEGGLSLRLKELGPVGGVVRNLVTIGLLVSWLGGAVAAHFLFGLDFLFAAMVAAIFVVTGPTVIGPLLRHVRPTGSVGSILKWEGIVTDPIGAMLAVLLFEIIHRQDTYAVALWGALKTLLAGGAVGAVGALFLWQLLKRHLVPDFLQNPLSLMLVLMVFVGGNQLQAEAGLIGVTLMGIMLANQRDTPVGHIIEFKENLRVLLISTLFILLAALLTRADFASLSWAHFAFLGVLIFVVRPLTVLVSTLKSKLDWREKLFVCSVAPRGIVAAAVASVLSLQLQGSGHAEEVRLGELLVPLTFLVIMGTVAIYGLAAAPIGRWLGLSEASRRGFLILGAHPWARAMAKVLTEKGNRVLLVDNNRRNVSQARLDGLAAAHVNLLAEHSLDDIDLSGLGQFLALTANDEINTLACLHVEDVFGRSSVYQLTSEEAAGDEVPKRGIGGRLLFAKGVTYSFLEVLFRHGSVFKATSLSSEFNIDAYHEHHGDEAVPLFVVAEPGKVRPFTAEAKSTARPGAVLVGMVPRNAVART